jgi:hypothetical protein
VLVADEEDAVLAEDVADEEDVAEQDDAATASLEGLPCAPRSAVTILR